MLGPGMFIVVLLYVVVDGAEASKATLKGPLVC
jgi:hypothetical protein